MRMIFYSLVVAVTLSFLVLAFGFSLLMNRLATRKRARAIMIRHEARARVAFPWVHHLPQCRCSLVTGIDRHCRNRTLFDVAAERKRLLQKKNATGANPSRNSLN